ncbi:MAG: UvrD-helicase domain-containing protein [Pseudomonadota bacterium]|nr:UvrD-helicase domain-containing protein [Pseudomonadota bacterium]
MAKLNPQQDEAVRYADGPLLVLAGAGSGKTRVITQKIAFLANECGYSPSKIVAVTFTNKAAREMGQRLSALMRNVQGRGPLTSTFHSLGLQILRRQPDTVGLKSKFSLFDTEDSRGLLKELTRRDTGVGDKEVAVLQSRISTWKNELVTPEDALAQAEDDTTYREASLYGEYERHLRAYNAVDFDDLIALPVRLLERDPAVCETWQNSFRHILVDEYQDTNAAQYRLLKRIAGPRASFTVVGDDDQSIYAWRGARPQNLQQLQADFPILKVVKLEQNYRSTETILKAANGLIAHNSHLYEKRLWSALGRGDAIRIVACESGEDEVQRVVSELLQRHFQKRLRYSDLAILYRSNHQARAFERALREHKVPYRITGGSSFFDAAEVRDVMAYLRLLYNPDDDAAFLRIVNTPRREIGASTLEKLGLYAQTRGISLLTACHEMGLAAHVSERALDRLHQFAEWVIGMQRVAAEESATTCVKRLLDSIDYANWLIEISKDRRAGERRQENVNDLVGWLSRLQEKWDGEPTLEALLAHISLIGMLERRDDQTSEDAVQLMTFHSAKGLEFDHVYMVGVEEELLPHRNSIDAGTIEEERRLAYVGITRARKTLTITYAGSRRMGGEEVDREPSRFLSELPPESVEWEKPGMAVDPAQRMERGRSQLAALRELLRGEAAPGE